MSATGIRLAAIVVAIAASGCSAASTPAPRASTVATTTAAAGELVLDGVAQQGALPSCITFRSVDGRRFVLLDGNAPLGVPISVRGVPDPGSASYCNAGTPLHVVAVTPR